MTPVSSSFFCILLGHARSIFSPYICGIRMGTPEDEHSIISKIPHHVDVGWLGLLATSLDHTLEFLHVFTHLH